MRALWTGRLQFSLFDFPIKIYSATQSEEISFNMLHAACGSKIKYEKRCPIHGMVLEEEICKGYEYEKGKFVTIAEADLNSLAPKDDRALEILFFVEQPALDPLMFDTPYYMTPEGPLAIEAYNTLRESMRGAGKYGIGRLVMRRKEYLVALWVKENAIVVSTLRYDNELRSTELLTELTAADKRSKEQIKMAVELIDRHTKKFRPKNYKDGYHEKLLSLIKDKVAKQQAEERQPSAATKLAEAGENGTAKPKRDMARAPLMKKPRRKTGTDDK